MSKITDGFEDKVYLLTAKAAWGKAFAPSDVVGLLLHARALEAMLKKHEWIQDSIDEDGLEWDWCEECREYKHNGHKSNCELAKLLD